MGKKRILKPLFKYPGGKSSEYKYLKKLFPKFNTYIEPFVGGGAVYWAIESDYWIINDFSRELISIYNYTQQQDISFIKYIQEIGIIWEKKQLYVNDILNFLVNETADLNNSLIQQIAKKLLSLTIYLPRDVQQLVLILESSILRKRKSLARIAKKEEIQNWEENALGVLGAALYTYFREVYNEISYDMEPQLKTALYFFLREYAYSAMFRYNADGLFNVPFGGNTYAKKSFLQKYIQTTSEPVIRKLQNTLILQGDFSKALIDKEDTFMFLDPPYDSEFSTYNLHVFDAQEQVRLRDTLLTIKKTKWLMVVKSTDFIENLYDKKGWYKTHFDKSYSVNFKNRNDKNVKHLVITNYRLEEI